MENKWFTIWNERSLADDEKSILEQLIQADGFDSGAGSFSLNEWIKHSRLIYNKINLDIKSLYEVGCGSGAFLYPFYKKGLHVGGIDYSESLIKIAKETLQIDDLCCDEAIHMDTQKKYDCIVSHSVFQYFPSITYAQEVIYKMIKKAEYKIVILDINDIDKKDSLEKLRRGKLGEKEYTKKYKGLTHLYLSKNIFYDIAKKENLSIDLFYTQNSEYLNAQYRFNIVLTK